MLTYGPAHSSEDLQAIQGLQKANLPEKISETEAIEQGFVTVAHSLELLQEMNEPYHHSAAWWNGQLIGYALVMETAFKNRIPVLFPMFELLDGLPYKGRKLSDRKYFVMGQVCVDKSFRGKGVFSGLYLNLKERLHSDFDLIATEIATRNTRSLRAHQKIGFEIIHIYKDPMGEEWAIVVWPIS